MFDVSSLLYGVAWAAETAPAVAAEGDATSSLMRFAPLFLIFAVFYFLLIRPQQKKLDEHAGMIKALKKGDKVITGGGIVGSVVKLDDDEKVTIEIAEGVQVKMVRSTISSVVAEKSSEKAGSAVAKKK
jgi:preprotein translocase subunit YajC